MDGGTEGNKLGIALSMFTLELTGKWFVWPVT
jgi:hypothetical protein